MNKDYEHRRQWVIDRLQTLSSVFAIDLAAFAVMHNQSLPRETLLGRAYPVKRIGYYHLVIRVDEARARSWSGDEVLEHWTRLYQGSAVVRRYLRGDRLSEFERRLLKLETAKYRSRLFSLSWFISNLNQFIARLRKRGGRLYRPFLGGSV